MKRNCGVSSRSIKVLTKVGVADKEYDFKRIDTLLRKWNAKATKEEFKGFCKFYRVLEEGFSTMIASLSWQT